METGKVGVIGVAREDSGGGGVAGGGEAESWTFIAGKKIGEGWRIVDARVVSVVQRRARVDVLRCC